MRIQTATEVIMRPQQEMNYSGTSHDGPGFTHSGYQGLPPSSFPGEKLSGRVGGKTPTASQRLTLAIVSLAMFILLTFGMIGIAAATQAPIWVILPIFLVLFLFSAVAVVINIVFNSKA
jgi:hypothetical protein